MSSKTMAKRAAAGTLALAVCLTGGAALASSAQAATGFKFDTRVAGDDRYQTAVAASVKAFPNGSDSVVLVNGDRTVDGLTASYVAGVHSAPILYVNSDGNTVSPETAAELIRLKATKAYIVGGTTVVSAALEAKLGSTGGTVVRYGGTDRYETAAKVAKSGTDTPSKVLVASGERFADALVVGPEAFQQHYPILLTSSTGVPSYTAAALKSIAAKDVKVIGGTAVVSESTYTAVGGTVRLADDNRQGTAVKVAADAIANEGFSKASLGLVGNLDRNAADALVAAPLAGAKKTPLLFIDAGITGAPTATYLKAHAAELTGTGYVFGGPAAVPQTDVDDATKAAVGTVTTNESYKVAVDGASTVEVDSAGKGSVRYVVTGLGNDNVDIALFAPSSLNISSDGVSFVDANGDLVADRTAAANASVSVVNGVSQAANTGLIYNVKPTSGTITFTVAATGSSQVVPVVYANSKGATSFGLKVDAAVAPTEKFGIGSQAGFVPSEASFGAHIATVAAGAVNFEDGYFVGTQTAVDATYYNDSNDTYKYQGVGITIEQFASILQGGGKVSVAYATTKSGASTFNITEAMVPSVSAVKALAAGDKGTDVAVSWTAPEKATGITYSVWRSDDDALLNTTKDTRVAKDLTGTTFTDAGVDDGDHYYFVVVSNTANGAQDGGVSSAKVTTPLAADVAKPTSLETVVEDGGFSGVLDTGDIISVGASEAVKLGSNPGLVVTDATSTVTLDSSNATFALDGQAIKVTLTKTPTYGTSATTVDLTKAKISNSRSITDGAGNVLDTSVALTVAAAPTGGDNDPAVVGTAAEKKFTVTFPTAIDASTVTAADFTVPTGNSVSSVVVDSDAKKVTVNLANALAQSEVVGIKAKTVKDSAHTISSPSVAKTAKIA